MTLGLSAPASAATITGAIDNVSITPTAPKEGGQLTTSIDWKVPNGTQAGDTFSLTLSTYLRNLPLGFALRDPANNEIVANATLSSTSPAVITFTMTAYASTHLQTHGTAFVTSNFDGIRVPAGTQTPFTSTTPEGQSFTTVITPTGGPTINPAIPSKYGSYARADQGRLNPNDFLIYHVASPVGPFESATVSDPVPVGQSWAYDCDTLQLQDVTLDANGLQKSATPIVGGTFTCDPTNVTAAFPAQVAGHQSVLRILVSLPAATGVATPPQTFLNRAVVGWTANGVTQSQAVNSSDTQASAGGTGVGTAPVPAVTIVKGDSDGNAADTDATAATLPANGRASLVYTVTNTGSEALRGIQVTDQVVANGTVTGLSCDFSRLGGPSTGTTFAGPFAVGASFPCTAALSGVSSSGADHHDVGTITAVGATSGVPVTASNDYFAKLTAQPAGGTPTGPGAGTPPTSGTPPVTTPVGSPIAPAATPATPLAISAGTSLAYTGTDVASPLALAGLLFALGAAFTTVAAARRRRSAAAER